MDCIVVSLVVDFGVPLRVCYSSTGDARVKGDKARGKFNRGGSICKGSESDQSYRNIKLG